VRTGCTTYIAALLVEELSTIGRFLDYPNLIRLNPNIPWKTRGNGAVCLRLRVVDEHLDDALRIVVDTVNSHADFTSANTEPGIVFLSADSPMPALHAFATQVIQQVVTKDAAFTLAKRHGLKAIGLKGGRGVIGALAAVGETLRGDHTYELITYRKGENRGTPRRIDVASVFEMDRKTVGRTFSNVDYAKRRVLIAPRGPDPVLFGIRGESADAVFEAAKLVVVEEEVERWVIFRTNQGTDAHLRRVERVDAVRPHHPVIVTGLVSRGPMRIPGRHVIFTLQDATGEIDCAVYEPTGPFRNVAMKLITGDHVEVHGGVRPPSDRHPLTVNLEKLALLRLRPKMRLVNPTCRYCGKSMTSMGKGKGHRCKKCGFKTSQSVKVALETDREILAQLYLPPVRAHRHLTKPRSRYGIEKRSFDCVPRDFWGLDTTYAGRPA
jgi:tRNA(Ile2)-agmatinylcytidine synthase